MEKTYTENTVLNGKITSVKYIRVGGGIMFLETWTYQNGFWMYSTNFWPTNTLISSTIWSAD